MKPPDALARIIEHREIFHEEMLSLMRQIMSGEVSPVLISAIITGTKPQRTGSFSSEATRSMDCASSSRNTSVRSFRYNPL